MRPLRPPTWAWALSALLLSSCTLTPPPAPPSAPAPPAGASGSAAGASTAVPAASAPATTSPRPSVPAPSSPAPGAPATPAATGTAPRPAAPPRVVKLPPPRNARHWDDFRQQAAQRLVQAHPDASYLGPVPEPLLAIPVLEVELNADGSVRKVVVLRHPRQARDTTQLAIDAVHRAAPYGAMTGLARPWKWTETFLFDEQRRFKPRSLDVD